MKRFLLLLFFASLLHADTFTVTQTGDSGPGSLRQAINDANNHAGGDTIRFQIPTGVDGHDAGAGVWVIRPQAFLDWLLDPGTFIDGASQAAFIGGDPNPLGPEIVIDGSEAGSTPGLDVRADSCRIIHLVLHSFHSDQLCLRSDGNTVRGCFLGTLHNGVSPGMQVTGCDGIYVRGSGNIIGGTEPGQGNVISGNGYAGISLSMAVRTQIAGNLIGVTVNGDAAVPNYHGISGIQTCLHNTIGPDNVISGNTIGGINFNSADCDSNRIFGNRVGTNAAGDAALPNGEHGIRFDGGNDNLIGGDLPEEGNVISGNGRSGVALYDSSSYNRVAHNLIGVAVDGETPLSNQWDGVDIRGSSCHNTVGPENAIAHNGGRGVSVMGEEADFNTITRNRLFSNGDQGIFVAGGANRDIQPPEITRLGSVIGTAPAGSRVEIFSTDDREGRIFEGAVSADGAGHFEWPDDPSGPYVTATATDGDGNTSEFSQPRRLGGLVVTTTADSVEGSLRWAVGMAEANAGPDTIRFEIPDSDPGYDAASGTWTLALGYRLWMQDDDTFIDGASQAEFMGEDVNPQGPEILVTANEFGPIYGFEIDGHRNTLHHLALAGFDYVQIKIDGDHNRIQQCYLGCGSDGLTYTGIGSGIWVYGGNDNVIGGETPDFGNVIAGLQSGEFGIDIYSASQRNVISHNIIGLNRTGGDTLGCGTGIDLSQGAAHTAVGPGNVISGNRSYGVILTGESTAYNRVFGNRIGTSQDGSTALGNGNYGIYIGSGASNNTVGGDTPEERNVISGNAWWGLYLIGAETDSNTVQGNYIGTDGTGSAALPNGQGGIRMIRANETLIGGMEPGQGNLISGNTGGGIYVSNTEAVLIVIAGNRVGVDTAGNPLPNTTYGIGFVSGASDNTVGPDNIVAHHDQGGVIVSGSTSTGNRITRNSIYNNHGIGIVLNEGSNTDPDPPVITGLGSVYGTASANTVVEVFQGPDKEGKHFLGSTTADAAGHWSLAEMPTGPYITATSTDAAGNTSEFSNAWHLGPYIVINTANEGEGSLDWAMEEANAKVGPDTILFDIPRSDPGFDGSVWSIVPDFHLPEINDDGLVIDGTTQEDVNPDGPDLFIDGRQASDWTSGLNIRSAFNVISGLVISGFGSYGISIAGDSSQFNQITGCFIGVTPAGDDTVGRQYAGIFINNGAMNNWIGGDMPEEGNLISGHKAQGCIISADSNRVSANLIGVDRTGMIAIPNGYHGVDVDGTGNVIGGVLTGDERRSNVISGNGQSGVNFYGQEDGGNVVMGNLIGVNRDGSGAIPNTTGVTTGHGANGNQILFNVISGNIQAGIEIDGGDSTVVRGNYIGVDAEAAIAIPNGYSGIDIHNGSAFNIIGGDDPADGNVISGNVRHGVEIRDQNTLYNEVKSNKIGTDGNGILPIPNQQNGVQIRNKSRFTQVGPNNIIAFNQGDGVEIRDNVTWGHIVTVNSIHSNGGLGIDLTNNGNGEMSAPTLSGVNPVTGRYNLPCTLIEIYSDSSNQGRVFEDSVRTDGSGNFQWNGIPVGPYITATAVTGSGTSEFSDTLSVMSSVDRLDEAIPREFALHQNYPNPFNPETTIRFDAAAATHVALKVYNIRGREVATLMSEKVQAGSYRVHFETRGLPSGAYFYRIEMDGFTAVHKMMILE